MSSNEPSFIDIAEEIHKKAEFIVQCNAVRSPDHIDKLPSQVVQKLVYELRVHQVELELQIEELHRTQAQLDIARVRYYDLYDMAPVGYLTLNRKGLILEANSTAATMLGVPRGILIKQPFTLFIHKEDQDR